MRSLSDGERAILAQDGPEEEAPDFKVLEWGRHVARKAYLCQSCGIGYIAPGEPYDRMVALNEGRFEIDRHCTRQGCKRGCGNRSPITGDCILGCDGFGACKNGRD